KAELTGALVVFRRPALSRRPERKRHGPFNDHFAIDAGVALQQSHPAAQPNDFGFDDHNVSRMHGAAETHTLDAGEKNESLTIYRLRENHDRAHLRDRFSKDGRRQHRRLAVREIALVERYILDPDDALVDFEFRDAINEQKRITMGK